MGTSLTGTKIRDTYDALLKVSDNGALDGTLQTLTDGLGNNSALSLSTAGASVTGTLAVSGNLTVDTDTLFVDASSNEIGIGTLSPDGTLHIHTGSAGTVTAEAASDNLVVENSGDGGVSILTPDANFGKLTFGSPAKNEGAIIRYNQASTTMTIGTEIASGLLQFRTGGGTERMRIDSSGNVGIGTSSPSAKLDVVDANGIGIRMGDISAAPVSQTAVYVGVSTSALTGGNGDLVLIPRTSDARNIVFYAGSGTPTERMRIDSSGNLLVGVTTGAKLSVSYGGNDTHFGLGGNYDNYITAGSSGATIFRNSTTERMRIDSSGNVTINENLIFPEGKGVFFGATAGGGATSSLFDDYEEGTWTPTASANIGIDIIDNATYTKIGNIVTIQAYITVDTSSAISIITGIPFNVSGRNGAEVTNATAGVPLGGIVLGGNLYIYAPTTYTDNGFYISATYRVA